MAQEKSEVVSRRIGIYAPQCVELGTALTAALSKQSSIELVEREDLGRVVEEKRLEGLKQSGVYQDANKLLGAQYLVWLDSRLVAVEGDGKHGKAKPVPVQSMRLIDCKSGSLFAWTDVPQSLDLGQAAEWLAGKVVAETEKARAMATQKISLLGLRCETGSAEARILERELNVALGASLQMDSRSLVLERWQLNDLLFEKELVNPMDSPFWTGSTLVDGSVSQKGNELSVRLRIRKAGDETGTIISCAGERDKIVALVSSLREAILGQPGSNKEPVASWGSEKEAQRYAAEGEWLLDHWMMQDGAQALETAWALGDHRRKTEMLRVKAYAMCAFPDNLMGRPYVRYPVQRFKIRPEEIKIRVEYAEQMQHLADDYLRRYGKETEGEKFDPLKCSILGVHSLFTGLRVLRLAHETGYYLENPESVRRLREAVRQSTEVIRGLGMIRNKFVLESILLGYAAYWNETPTDTIQYYQTALSADYERSNPRWIVDIREVLKEMSDGFHRPILPSYRQVPIQTPPQMVWFVIDWTGQRDEELSQLWQNYIDELWASKNPLQQADGWRLYGSALPDQFREMCLSAKFDFLVANRELLTTTVGGGILQDVGSNFASAMHPKVIEFLCETFSHASTPLDPTLLDFLRSMCGYELTAEEASRLSQAMKEHLSHLQKKVDGGYVNDVEEKRRWLKEKFPVVIAGEASQPLVVSHVWIPGKNSPDKKANEEINARYIWCEKGCVELFNQNDNLYWKINLSTLKSEEMALGENRDGFFIKSPARVGDKIYVVEREKMSVIDLVQKTKKLIDVPPQTYSLYAHGGKVWAAFGDLRPGGDPDNTNGVGLYQIDPATDAVKLIFSTRRRPAEHPLDELKEGRPAFFLPCGEEFPILSLLVKGKQDCYQTQTGKLLDQYPFRFFSQFTYCNGQTVLFDTGRGGGGVQLNNVARVNPDGKFELLLNSGNPARPITGSAVWSMPAECKEITTVNGYLATMMGDDLLVLSCGASEMLPGGVPNTLYWFRRNYEKPLKLTLQFKLPSEDQPVAENSSDKTRGFESPSLWDGGLTATPQGIVLMPSHASGFWFIPMDDLNNAAREQPEKSATKN